MVTNFYDLTWAHNVSAGDLLTLNPSGGTAQPGEQLRLPCYPPGKGGLAPSYFGGSIAYLQFSGGNQVQGRVGLGGAMSASGVNDHLPNQVCVCVVGGGGGGGGGVYLAA